MIQMFQDKKRNQKENDQNNSNSQSPQKQGQTMRRKQEEFIPPPHHSKRAIDERSIRFMVALILFIIFLIGCVLIFYWLWSGDYQPFFTPFVDADVSQARLDAEEKAYTTYLAPIVIVVTVVAAVGLVFLTEPRSESDYEWKKSDGSKITPKVPLTVEDVPFRRQDRRVLNARKKRFMDKQLISCILVIGVTIFIIGAVLIGVYWGFEGKNYKNFIAVIITGVVLCGFSLFMLIFSIEVCQRLKKNAKRVQDPDIDAVGNLHHVKHWVYPEIIPYGWGQDGNEQTSEVSPVGRDKAVFASSRGGVKMSNLVHPDSPEMKLIEEEEPHQLIALQLMNSVSTEEEDIDSDVYDESLRFSHIDRPSLIVNKPSSPARTGQQIRGDFVNQEEKIANLFAVKNKNFMTNNP